MKDSTQHIIPPEQMLKTMLLDRIYIKIAMKSDFDNNVREKEALTAICWNFRIDKKLARSILQTMERYQMLKRKDSKNFVLLQNTETAKDN